MREEIRVTVEMTFDMDVAVSRKLQREHVVNILDAFTGIGSPLWDYKIKKFESEAEIYGNK